MSASLAQYGPGSTITVHVNYARDLYDTELFGAMDPYCLVILGALQYRTETKKNAGKYPTWNQLFSFHYNNETVLRFVVFDKDTISSDDTVGEAMVSLVAIADKGGDWTGDLQLYRKKNKSAGAINVRIQMTPSGGYKPVVQAQPIVAAQAKPIVAQQATIVPPPQPIVQGQVVIPQQQQQQQPVMMMAPPQPMGYAPPPPPPPYQPTMMSSYQPMYSPPPPVAPYGPPPPPPPPPMYAPPPPQQPYYYGGWRGE